MTFVKQSENQISNVIDTPYLNSVFSISLVISSRKLYCERPILDTRFDAIS
jgi:hypothetical protein